MQAIEDLDGAAVDALLAEPGVAVIEFWGAWCGPCRAMAGALGATAQTLAGRVTIAKVDIASAVDVAARFRVLSVPTLIRLRDGVEIARHTGAMTAEELLAFCEAESAT